MLGCFEVDRTLTQHQMANHRSEGVLNPIASQLLPGDRSLTDRLRGDLSLPLRIVVSS